MDKQEVFNTVYKHLIEQGKPAKNNKGCAYRGDDGTKCAIGVLIKDEEYSTNMEGMGVVLLVEKYPNLSIAQFVKENTRLSIAIQTAHDFSETAANTLEFTKEIKEEFYKISIEYGLKVPEHV